MVIGVLGSSNDMSTQATEQAQRTEPTRLIFDTDICGDCDDVLALGMIHALQDRGLCRLLAVTISVDHEQAARFVNAVNTFYGRGNIPLGVVGKGGRTESSKFLSLVEEPDKESGGFRFPHDLASARAAAASRVLRKVLATQPNRSVVIVQVGFSTNLARLLESPPDEYSPLRGLDLVKQKVRLLSLMAGAFTPIGGEPRYREYNVTKDIGSARALAEGWPGKVVFSGYEIGAALPYPSLSIERDFRYVAHHPLAEAYVRRNPPPHNRPTWDLTSVLHAVLGDRGYFDLSPPGKVTVEPDGFTRFDAAPEGRHHYLVLRPQQKLRILEAMVLLASQPPLALAR
jgi:hypothetical protein